MVEFDCGLVSVGLKGNALVGYVSGKNVSVSLVGSVYVDGFGARTAYIKGGTNVGNIKWFVDSDTGGVALDALSGVVIFSKVKWSLNGASIGYSL